MTSRPALAEASSLASRECWMTLTIPGTRDWNEACKETYPWSAPHPPRGLNPPSAPEKKSGPRRKSTHNLGGLIDLDELRELSQCPDGPYTDRKTLGILEGLAEEVEELGEVVLADSSGLGGGDGDGVEEHVDGLEADLAVGCGGRGGESPQPGDDFGPGAFGDLDAGESGGEAGGSGASLGPTNAQILEISRSVFVC